MHVLLSYPSLPTSSPSLTHSLFLSLSFSLLSFFLSIYSRGTVYSVDDPSCPLQLIGMAVNQSNIWLNKNITNFPYQMDWNIEGPNAKGMWEPFFNPPKFKRPQSLNESIQLSRLKYEDTPPEFAVQMELGLKKEVQNELEDFFFKRHRALKQNRALSSQLYGVLKRLEVEKMPKYAEAVKAKEAEQGITHGIFCGDENVPHEGSRLIFILFI